MSNVEVQRRIRTSTFEIRHSSFDIRWNSYPSSTFVSSWSFRIKKPLPYGRGSVRFLETCRCEFNAIRRSPRQGEAPAEPRDSPQMRLSGIGPPNRETMRLGTPASPSRLANQVKGVFDEAAARRSLQRRRVDTQAGVFFVGLVWPFGPLCCFRAWRS